jgi:hypothetical protein
MTREDLIYTAALVDGEGSVMLTKCGNERRHPVLLVPSTTYGFMTFLKKNFKGNISTKKKYQEHHKDSWVWSATHNLALSILKLIVPFMKEPKKVKRAKLLLKDYKKYTLRNGRYNARQLRAKMDFEKRFHALQ